MNELIFNKDAFADVPEYDENSFFVNEGRIDKIPYNLEKVYIKYIRTGHKINIQIVADIKE